LRVISQPLYEFNSHLQLFNNTRQTLPEKKSAIEASIPQKGRLTDIIIGKKVRSVEPR